MAAGWRAEVLRRCGWTIVLGLLPLVSVFAQSAAPALHIFIAGDSTASEYGPERAPRTGWGQVIGTWFDRNVTVANQAQSGRSSRSFIEQGWLYGIAREIRRGDLLLIQFGHNDEKRSDPSRYTEPQREFPVWLKSYVEFARRVGATPILITPVTRRHFVSGEPVDLHGPYAEAVRALAAREAVALIDLDRLSLAWLRSLGETASTRYFLHVPEQDLTDNTHFQEHGAQAIACLIVDALKRQSLIAAGRIVRDTDCAGNDAEVSPKRPEASVSRVEARRDRGVTQPGPHGGAGTTEALNFFLNEPSPSLVLRKRVLHPGASIGLHKQDRDEIYYVLSGRGRYVLDQTVHAVSAGDALLTRPGSTHAIQQSGDDDLVLLICYPTSPRQ
ncbi:MAG: cupin domain-containing protein [Tahibacter sp.]